MPWIPDIPGRPMSTSITLGTSSGSFASASSTDPYAHVHLNPVQLLIKIWSPARISFWSSMMATVNGSTRAAVFIGGLCLSPPRLVTLALNSPAIMLVAIPVVLTNSGRFEHFGQPAPPGWHPQAYQRTLCVVRGDLQSSTHGRRPLPHVLQSVP